MKMSVEYLEQTVRRLAECGFSTTTEQVSYGEGDEGHGGVVHRLRRGADTCLTLEAVEGGGGRQEFYLAIDEHAGLSCTSYRLDSWKYFDNRIEFKYEVDPNTAKGVSFVLALEPQGETSG